MEWKHLGVMLDCSRNGVLRVESVKMYIRILERLGFQTLMLYTEDTYEVSGHPFFGYLRGRYTKEELKEIDAYAVRHQVELIPCIQTLAHLNGIVRWKEYEGFKDVNDILLAGDPRTYQLVDAMFATLAECFTSRTVNLGMDEAHMVGLGKYLDKNGYHSRFEILAKHLEAVCTIAKKYGFQPLIWSDMFFRLATGGDYYEDTVQIDPGITKQIPEGLGLIYWDYYAKNQGHYDRMLAAHRQFGREIWFAGGAWTWSGFTPKNGFSIDAACAVVPSLVENKIEHAIFTLWGDDGRECSYFAVLPCLYYISQLAKGVTSLEAVKEGFYKEFGIAFDDFMLLDLPGATDDEPRSYHNPEKYMFYNDCFNGIFDCTVKDGYVPAYDTCAAKLEKLAGHAQFGYLFDAAAKLCRFLQVKFTIGKRTRQAYRQGGKGDALDQLVADYEKMGVLLDDFYQAFRTVWFTENKPHGFDIQDIRFGGLKQRIASCTERLRQYQCGEVESIPELEEEILPEFEEGYLNFNKWAEMVSVQVVSHS